MLAIFLTTFILVWILIGVLIFKMVKDQGYFSDTLKYWLETGVFETSIAFIFWPATLAINFILLTK